MVKSQTVTSITLRATHHLIPKVTRVIIDHVTTKVKIIINATSSRKV